ncbi:hypothetical protein KSP40_PGU008127 [Platanthera guangdongensis]|uniref:Uncharacterized protein n=1 Tax=Platanthera guangdongensis TaxID=2320717 RepID=A0ABR2M5H7_9ASPA
MPEKEPMIRPWQLKELNHSSPPILLQLLIVDPSLVPQQIQLRDAHQHTPAPQIR